MNLRIVCTLALLLLLPWTRAQADGISIEHLALSEVAQRSGNAAAATLIGLDKAANTIDVQIRRTWAAKDHSASYEVGKRYTLQMPFRQEMVPGRWLAVEQYWNELDWPHLKEGMDIILFPNSPGSNISTVIAKNKDNLRKLNLFMSPRWQQRHSKASIAQLNKDLADFDLYKNAYKTLASRKKLSDSAVFLAALSAKPHDLLSMYLPALSDKRRGTALRHATKVLKTKANPRLRALILQYWSRHDPSVFELPALASLADTLNFGTEEDASAMYDLAPKTIALLSSKEGKQQTGRFVDSFARYIPARPHYGEVDAPIFAFIGLLSKSERASLIDQLMTQLQGDKKGKLNEFSFDLVAKYQTQVSVTRLLEFTTKIHLLVDTDGNDGCDQINELIVMIVSLARRAQHRDKLGPVAAAVLKQYRCNVDRRQMQNLAAIAR